MPDSKPTPPEDQKADSFVGRLSVVCMYMASIAGGVAGVGLSMPTSDPTKHKFFENLFVISIFVWPAYLVIIYLCGRYKEAFKRCFPGASVHGDSFYGPSLIPFAVSVAVWVVSWFMWRLPDGIRWVGELFGS